MDGIRGDGKFSCKRSVNRGTYEEGDTYITLLLVSAAVVVVVIVYIFGSYGISCIPDDDGSRWNGQQQ